MRIEVQRERIVRELAELATFSTTPVPSVTRIVFTEPDLEARVWLKDLCKQGGLAIREDAVGNMFARWSGAEPDLPAVATGSHIDAIPNAGAFDGTVGVLGGLEAIRALQSSGFQPRRSIELLLFTSEEPTRFGIGCLGSRLLSGTLSPQVADLLVDENGITLADVRQTAGFLGSLESVRLSSDCYSAFIELHIEQGPILERDGIEVGVVTHIAAPAALRIEIEGEGGHAGAVLMRDRRDAFVAAAELAVAVETAALATGSADTVATTGVCKIFPGAVNSIPSRVELSADIRDIDLQRRDSVLDAVKIAAERIAKKRDVTVTTSVVNADPPAVCDPNIVAALAASCEQQGRSYRRMVSRAYHDSLFMSRVCPVSMLFIPCRNGVSHRPDEYASEEHIENGIRVLAATLARLAGE